MLTNPYPPPKPGDDLDALRFQTYLSGVDKSLLMSVRPVRGTAQCVINHLIQNLCNDLRRFDITTYHPDADTIFSILTEPRKLTTEQLERLGCAITGSPTKVSAWLQQHRRGSEVREGPANTPTGPHHPKVSAESRIGRHREKTTGEKKGNTKTSKVG